MVHAQESADPALELSDELEVRSNIHTMKWRVFTDRATILSSEGSHELAEKFFYLALNEAKQGFGDDDPHVASCYNNLAEHFRLQKNYEKAEPLYLEAIDRLKQSLGPEHGSVGFAMHNLASLYLLQNRLEESQQYYQSALNVKRRALGPDHPEYANTMFHLGEVMHLRGNATDAVTFISSSIQILQDVGLGSTAIAVRRMFHLARILMSSGKISEAEDVLRKAVKVSELSSNFRTIDLVNAMETLASVLHREGKLEECEGLLEKCLDVLKEKFGESNIRLAAVLSKLGGIAFQHGKGLTSVNKAQALESYDKAIDMLMRAVRIAKDANARKENLKGPEDKLHALVLLQSLYMLGVIRSHKLELVGDEDVSSQVAFDAEQNLQEAHTLLEDKEVKELLALSPEAKKLQADCLKALANLKERKAKVLKSKT